MLRAAFIDLARPGRKGIAVMRRLLDERGDGYVAPASELEASFVSLLRRYGLPEPGPPGRRRRRSRLGGPGRLRLRRRRRPAGDRARQPAPSLSKLDVEADAARDRRLRDAGWQVVRFCWADVMTEEPILTLIRTLPLALVTI